MFIYKIVNIVNNKIYIGKTTLTLEERFKNHIKAYKRWLKDNRGGCSYLYNAFNKYGIDKFKIYELDTANTEDELNKKEIYWINTLNSRDSNIGYNIAEGG